MTTNPLSPEQKRVGLETCFINNYGACLQAHALQTVIESLGFRCEIIKYLHLDTYKPPLNNSENQGKAQRVLRKLFRYIKNPRMLQEYRARKIKNDKFDSFRLTHLRLSKKTYNTFAELKNTNDIYDVYVCGSDQIWNPTFIYDRVLPAEFLQFAPKGKRRIAYAPSIGVSEIPESKVAEMQKYLNEMDCISVREEQGASLVEKLISTRPPVVLDPTLLLKGTYWRTFAQEITYKQFDIQKPYILFYFFGDQAYVHHDLIQIVRELNMQVVVLPMAAKRYPFSVCPIFDAGPLDFVRLISKAALVCTDSFHATAFSCNLGTPFLSFLRSDRRDKNDMSSRLLDFTKALGLSERMLLPEDSLPSYDKYLCMDFSEAQNRLDCWREESLNYLKNALRI